MNSSVALQLAWALATVLVVYVLASSARRTVAIGALLVMIPFQTVVTRYATSSVLMAYALAVILLLNGGIKVRMLPALGLVALAYLVSLSQADRALMSFHAIYIFQFFPASSFSCWPTTSPGAWSPSARSSTCCWRSTCWYWGTAPQLTAGPGEVSCRSASKPSSSTRTGTPVTRDWSALSTIRAAPPATSR
ncbi:MAG: hypothetical protein IPF50_11575 [Proteobacteria bacterium]|nr:hypothetical protein [Pseudomonadota bacterium]